MLRQLNNVTISAAHTLGTSFLSLYSEKFSGVLYSALHVHINNTIFDCDRFHSLSYLILLFVDFRLLVIFGTISIEFALLITSFDICLTLYI